MPHVHFIAIGGAAMHSLAIALSEDPAYRVTGSDDEIFEPSRSRLQAHGLLPAETGWHPERIDGSVDAVVVGMHATADNPELRRARELGLRIYSFPEYLYEHTRDKKRVVVGGSHGKTTTTAMILHVLHRAGIEADYMVGAQIEGLDNMVRLSADAQVAVFEGDEYLTSPLDPRPKFHLYKPHVAVLTGIAWDHINVFPTFDCYVEQFRRFAELIEPHGCLIYYEGDENLRRIAAGLRPDITALPYGTPAYEVREGTTCLLTGDGEVALQVFGEHNLQNIEAARLACGQLGVAEADFFRAIASFAGASNRLQRVAQSGTSVAYKDFAHSPSKLRATVQAVRKQYPGKRLVACMELHTFSSLTGDFLPQYRGCMDGADVAFVYYNPEVVRHKRLQAITPQQVQAAFGGGDRLTVLTDPQELQRRLRQLDMHDNTALLFMSSGNFSGIDVAALAQELIKE